MNNRLNFSFLFFFFVTSIYISFLHFKLPVHIFSLADYKDGTMHDVFSSRFLVFEINLFILELFGNDTHSKMSKIIMLFIDFIALFFTQILLFKVFRGLNFNKASSFAGVIIFIYIVIHNYLLQRGHNYYYNYDFLSIAFFAIFFYVSLFYPNKIIFLLFIVFIATFNRETSFLMPITYLFLNLKEKNKFLNLTFLLLIFVLAKLIVMYKFDLLTSPSSIVDTGNNERIFRNLRVLFFLEGDLAYSIYFYSIFGFLWIILLINISSKNKFNKLFYVLGINVIIILFVGNIDELRLWNEAIILFTVLFMTNLFKIHKKVL